MSILALVAGLGFAGSAQAAGTIAGTDIANTATATFDVSGGGSGSVTSNTVTLKVDELLDVTVASADPGDVPTTPSATNQVLTFTITNAGNGSEAFALTAVDNGGGDDFNPSVTSIVLDTNGNNAYDAGVDTVYVAGSNDPVLAPDASIRVFVLSTIPGTAADGDRGRVDLGAAAVTGTGTPGTTFANQGQGGGDAVVGASGADGSDEGYFVISAATLSLVKSATVLDQWGTATQVPGATITYTLVASATGTGNVANVSVADTIPTGTTYVPASITLDTIAKTDGNDADEGRFGSGAVTVDLGTVNGGSSRTITFQVLIDN